MIQFDDGSFSGEAEIHFYDPKEYDKIFNKVSTLAPHYELGADVLSFQVFGKTRIHIEKYWEVRCVSIEQNKNEPPTPKTILDQLDSNDVSYSNYLGIKWDHLSSIHLKQMYLIYNPSGHKYSGIRLITSKGEFDRDNSVVILHVEEVMVV